MTRQMVASVFMLALLAGCGQDRSDPSAFDKEDLRGKQDSSMQARICREHDQPRDCDVCEAAGWYGDGECDTFCRERDEDCALTCDDLENYVYDFCVPDDDAPVDWEECLEAGGYMELGRECCQEADGYIWCEEMGPDSGWCFGLDDGIGDCYVDFGDLEGCVPQPGDDLYAWAVICCEDMGFTFCDYMDMPLDLGFVDLGMPVPELQETAGHIGLMQVIVNRGNPFTQEGLRATLNAGRDYFGQQCDGVPEYHAEFDENASAESFISFMRHQTGDWEQHLSNEDLDALEAYLIEQGMEHYRIFYGRQQIDACGGSGEISVNLLWNTLNNQVIYLILYPWTD